MIIVYLYDEETFSKLLYASWFIPKTSELEMINQIDKEPSKIIDLFKFFIFQTWLFSCIHEFLTFIG